MCRTSTDSSEPASAIRHAVCAPPGVIGRPSQARYRLARRAPAEPTTPRAICASPFLVPIAVIAFWNWPFHRYGGSRVVVISMPWYLEEPDAEEGLEHEESLGNTSKKASAR